MRNIKDEILEKICYTDLVYERINKKLQIKLSKDKIEELILTTIEESDLNNFLRKGKNIYITNESRGILLTINSFTFRIITADKLKR
ncbi:MAG: DUF3781 domain-containing protein [Bacteroidales bacterium]|nr:DUF3781 domain-containing protein [Bacteroidales bacterium]MDD2624374.1 DUF3781 domain-containing protein [Candidatus Riflebacteria bacterium]